MRNNTFKHHFYTVSNGKIKREKYSYVSCAISALALLIPLTSAQATTSPKLSNRVHVIKHIKTSNCQAKTINVTSLFSDKAQHKKQQDVVVVKPDTHRFNISLKANETTGHKWFLNSYNHHLLKLVAYRYQVPHNDIVGAPGKAIFTFKVKKALHIAPFATSVVFASGQPWHVSGLNGLKFHWVSVISYAKSQHIKTSVPDQKTIAHERKAVNAAFAKELTFSACIQLCEKAPKFKHCMKKCSQSSSFNQHVKEKTK